MSAVAETQRHEGGHASAGLYWMIGVILTVVTAVEVAIFYIPQLSAVVVPALLILSAGKFVTVVAFYMHLKYDSNVFIAVFMAGFVLATFMVTALIMLYKVLPPYGVVPA